MLYLAIDQHRKQLTVDLRNDDGSVVLRRQVSTRWEPVRAFLADVQQRSQPAGGFVVILEVCGFNDWLLDLLAAYGARDIVLLHPEKPLRHKTDRRDANRLGELLWVNRHRLQAGCRGCGGCG
jgi:transposase